MVCLSLSVNSHFTSPELGKSFSSLLNIIWMSILIVFLRSIRPSSTVPICLDLGTNNQKFLDDPLYLGLRRRRVTDQEMTEFMEEFMREMTAAFPKLLIQFEVRDLPSLLQ